MNTQIMWLIAHADAQRDDNGSAIPDSGTFAGKLPGHMVTALKNYVTAAGTLRRDTGKRIVYSWRNELNTIGYSLSFGATNSTANSVTFNFCPDQW